MAKIKTNINPNYISNWTNIDAMREIIQEMLDVKYMYKCDGKFSYIKNKLVVTDSGPGLNKKDLALGVSNKTNIDGAIGQFGEGMKLAMLVAARNNREMSVRTKDFIIKPAIEYNKDLEIDTLTLTVNNTSTDFIGTQFIYECTQQEFIELKNLFVETNDNFQVLESTERGDVLSPRGYIFINGALASKFTERNLMFSYNFINNKELKEAQNRDRKIVDSNILYKNIAYIIGKITNTKLITKFLKNIFDENNLYFEGDVGYDVIIHEENKENWRKSLFSIFGEKICLQSTPINDLEASNLGYTVIKPQYTSFNHFLRNLNIKNSGEVVRIDIGNYKVSEFNETNQKTLLDIYNAILFLGFIELPEFDDIVIVDEIYENNEREIYGLWVPSENKILLKRILFEMDNFVLLKGVLVHEIVHKNTGYSDRTREFELKLTEIIGELL